LAKKKEKKPPRVVTKRQLSHWQQEKKRHNIILAAGILIITVVLVTVGAGWFVSEFRPMNQTVMSVNDAKFKMNYYVKALEFYSRGQSIPNMYLFADEVVRAIQQNELVKQEAESNLGISISNSEVDKELKSRDPPVSKDYRDFVRAQMLITKLRNEYFEQNVPTSAEQRLIMAMFLESENQTGDIRVRLEAGEDFAELAGEFSVDNESKNRKGDFGWQARDVLEVRLGSPAVGEYVFSSEVGVLSQPVYDEEKVKNVGYWLIEVLDRQEDPEGAYIQVMLLGTEKEVREVKVRIEAGEEFGTLAEELSQLGSAKEDAGYIGLISAGQTTEALDGAIFDNELEIGTLSEPVRDETMVTKGGYWLVQVLDEADDRRIEEADRELLKTKALNDWIQTLMDNPKNDVEIHLDDVKKTWAVERVGG